MSVREGGEGGELGDVLVDGSHLLVGGRNIVYKLGLADLLVQKSLEWSASEQDRSVCLVKGKSEASCQNYIKVLKKYTTEAGRFLVCGINAFKPECRDYVEDGATFLMTRKSKGVGLCPYGPGHNSTALLVGDQLYAGTAADYQVWGACGWHLWIQPGWHFGWFLLLPPLFGTFGWNSWLWV